MLRRPALAALLLLCACPSPALGNPAISVSASPVGALKSLPAKVNHRLTLTAGATPETVAVSTGAAIAVSGTGVTTGPVTALGPPTFACPSRWTHPHEPYGSAGRFSVTVTLAPFASAFLDATIALRKPPWA